MGSRNSQEADEGRVKGTGDTVREEAEWGGKAVIFCKPVKSLKVLEQN